MKQHYQGFNVEIITPLGPVLAKDYTLNFPDLFDTQNGVQILKDGDASGKLTLRAKALFALMTLAIVGGSWQEARPLEFLLINLNEDNGGLPIVILCESVLVHLPKDFSGNLIEGSDDWLNFDFQVLSQVFINGVPVFAKRNQASLL
ncbi:MAG: hypothetical protein A2527_14135 [Candidatus Lambdaproteobacteria bacterium RIFOXYD2_FULL_50_16]|uniref:Uncharacterized protein n=1 Tax=Candidatus Lambdaproteobacteria bacterium RIFOXYD2_FULL_50_16 TaxID=1817772 RepID=A0A1F6G4L9_9PROT|nr:MAG: hypothetical protein A2527_14135 [Candidatus Lambdaproteobacteria bacterium RIFOXYD2_FULL_50_16]